LQSALRQLRSRTREPFGHQRGIVGQVRFPGVERIAGQAFLDSRPRGLRVEFAELIQHVHQVRLPTQQRAGKPDDLAKRAFDGLLSTALESRCIFKVGTNGSCVQRLHA
jgi:hypothetical protein